MNLMGLVQKLILQFQIIIKNGINILMMNAKK